MNNSSSTEKGGTHTGYKIKIAQINMARTATANEDLLEYALMEGIDIALLHEPYARYHKFAGLEVAPLRIILAPGVKQIGGNNILHGAAIVVFNPALTVLSRSDLTCDNFAVASISLGDGETLNLFSTYFKFSTSIDIMIGKLQVILQKCGPRTIIGGNFNAFSTRWGSKMTNNKEILLEDFLDNEQLSIMKQKGQPFTFCGPRGENNIDLTLATIDITTSISHWKVLEVIVTSNHRLIYFEIGGKGTNFSKVITRKRYLTKKVDWGEFNRERLMQIYSTKDWDCSVEDRAMLIMQAITKASDKAIPKQKYCKKIKAPWWTKELEIQKKKMKSAQRMLGGNEKSRQQRRAEYNKERNEYVKLLRKEKMNSWRLFAGEINDNTWGKCFRWIKKESADREAPSVLKKQNGDYTKTLKESLRYLLDTLIPSDPTNSEKEELPFRETADYKATNTIEVKNVIWRMSTSKAPGVDGINAMILRKFWQHMGGLITKLFDDSLRFGYFPKISLEIFQTS